MWSFLHDLELRHPDGPADLVTFEEPIEHPLDVGLPFVYEGSLHLLSAKHHIWKCQKTVRSPPPSTLSRTARSRLPAWRTVNVPFPSANVCGVCLAAVVQAVHRTLSWTGMGVMAASGRGTSERYRVGKAIGCGHVWSDTLDLFGGESIPCSSAGGMNAQTQPFVQSYQ